MAVLLKIIKPAFALALFITCLFFVLVMLNAGSDYLQKTRNETISATINRYWISSEPAGPATRTITPGQEMFFNVHVVRPEGCFIDTSWRFALEYNGGHVVWLVDGMRSYAPPGEETLSQAVLVPAKLRPGHYVITRITGWQCGDRPSDFPAQNVLMVDAFVPAK